MKLQDAIKKMKPGDKFLAVGNKMFIMNRNYMLCRCHDGIAAGGTGLTVALLNLEGEIIKPEPGVLTEDEIVEQLVETLERKKPSAYGIRTDVSAKFVITRNELLDLAKRCTKNGQNKEYKRLVVHIKKYGTRCEVLENLQPPWEIEE